MLQNKYLLKKSSVKTMLSIIIVNYKTSQDIDICLESIIKYETHYKDYEYIIVDNNSDDKGLIKITKKYPFIKIIYAPKNGGFAYGNNVGIKASSGEHILLLNPDTFIEDNSIEKLYNRLNNGSDVDFIGPKLLFPDKRNQSYFEPKTFLTLWRLFCEKLYLHRIFKNSKIFNSYYRTYMDYDNESNVQQVNGAVFMFKKNVTNILGLLDEKYFMYFEESDYCLQAVKNGFKLLYYPKSIVIHTGGLITESNWERSTKDYVTSFKYYFKKNFNFTTYYMALILYFIGTLIRVIVLFFKGDNKYSYYYFHLKYLLKNNQPRAN